MRVFFDEQDVLVNDSGEDGVEKFRLLLIFSFLDDDLTDHLFFGFNVRKIVDEIKEALDVPVVILGPLVEGAVFTWTSAIVLDLHDFGTNEGLDIGQIVNGKDFPFLDVSGGENGKGAFQVYIRAVSLTVQREIKSISPESVSNVVIELL